jgi:hypothetical protein
LQVRQYIQKEVIDVWEEDVNKKWKQERRRLFRSVSSVRL